MRHGGGEFLGVSTKHSIALICLILRKIVAGQVLDRSIIPAAHAEAQIGGTPLLSFRSAVAGLFSVAVLSLATGQGAAAAVIVPDSGWRADEIWAANTPSANSSWTFTVATPAYFRITDAFWTGDVFSLYDGLSLLAKTTFTTTAETIDDYVYTAWSDTSYSRLSYLVGPGSYSFTITGDGVAGVPAGFAVRLDSVVSAVPEPATWAMMIIGFGAVGSMVRTSRRRNAFSA